MAYTIGIKPRIAMLNLQNPLTQGLLFDAPFFEGAGITTKEIRSNITGTIAASGATWETNRYGKDLDFSAAASTVSYTTPPSLNNMKTITIEVLGLIRTSGGGANGRFCDKNPASTVGYWKIYADGTNMIFQQDWATNKFIFIAFTPDSLWHHWVYTCSDLTATAASTMNMYKDGVLQTVSSQNGASTAPTDGTIFDIGNRFDQLRNLDGKIAYLRIWNRVLSKYEINTLYANPFGLYKTPALFHGLYK